MPGFLADADLLDSLQVILKPEEFMGEPVTTMPTWINQSVSDANVAAYGSILSILARRRFNPTQINSWYRGPEIQRDLGLYFICRRLIAANQLSSTMEEIKLLDRRPELLTMDLTDAVGNLILPTLTNPGGPGLYASGLNAVLTSETFRNPFVPITPNNPLQFRRGL